MQHDGKLPFIHSLIYKCNFAYYGKMGTPNINSDFYLWLDWICSWSEAFNIPSQKTCRQLVGEIEAWKYLMSIKI